VLLFKHDIQFAIYGEKSQDIKEESRRKKKLRAQLLRSFLLWSG